MKNTHKLLIGVMTLAILIPQVTFAAWWNPLSWKIFNRPQLPIPVVEIPIEKTEPVVEIQPEPTPIKKTVVPKIAPASNTNNQSSEIEKLKNEIEVLKQKVDQYNQPTATIPNTAPAVIPPTNNSNTQIVIKPATVPPPTTYQLKAFEKVCLEVPDFCKDQRVRSGYMSDLKFRASVDEMVKNYNQKKNVQQQQAIAAQKTQLECLSAPLAPELRTLSPEQQRRIREVKCGTNTPQSDLEYKLYQQQQYQECVNKNPTNYSWYCEKPIFY